MENNSLFAPKTPNFVTTDKEMMMFNASLARIGNTNCVTVNDTNWRGYLPLTGDLVTLKRKNKGSKKDRTICDCNIVCRVAEIAYTGRKYEYEGEPAFEEEGFIAPTVFLTPAAILPGPKRTKGRQMFMDAYAAGVGYDTDSLVVPMMEFLTPTTKREIVRFNPGDNWLVGKFTVPMNPLTDEKVIATLLKENSITQEEANRANFYRVLFGSMGVTFDTDDDEEEED